MNKKPSMSLGAAQRPGAGDCEEGVSVHLGEGLRHWLHLGPTHLLHVMPISLVTRCAHPLVIGRFGQ